MKIRLIINEKYKEPEVHVCNCAEDEGTKELYRTLTDLLEVEIIAYSGEKTTMLRPSDIVRVYAQNKQVYITTETGEYRIRERLYEMEKMLPANRFVRISNSEIINIKKLLRMDTSVTGTILMYLKGNVETYVSRRNVAKIKLALGIK